MRKVKALCLLLVAIFVFGCFVFPDKTAPVTATASTDIVTAPLKDLIYDIYDEGDRKTVAISGYTGNDKKIIVPATIEGYPVTYLAQSSFGDSKTLEYIELPANVEYIETGLFDSSLALKEIAISSKNKYYTCVNGILYNKDKTTLMAFPAGRGGSFTVPKSVVTIADQAFYYCYLLENVKMYNNVRSIGSYAFAMCWNLKSLRLSDNLQILGYKALYNCKSLSEIHLPYTLKTIGRDALVGGIDSDDNVFYYTTKGIYYVKGSPAEKYVKSLDLPTKYLKTETRTITDIATNTVLHDSAGAFPKSGKLDLSVKVLSNSTYSDLLPCRYAKMLAYKIAFLKDGKEYTLPKASVIEFGKLGSSAIPTATKIYVMRGGTLVERTRAPQAAFVGTTLTYPDTYVVTTNNDFSLKGDIDGDGTRTIYDARFALCIAAGLVKDLTSAQRSTANVDGTAGIKTGDAREILRYAAGIK